MICSSDALACRVRLRGGNFPGSWCIFPMIFETCMRYLRASLPSAAGPDSFHHCETPVSHPDSVLSEIDLESILRTVSNLRRRFFLDQGNEVLFLRLRKDTPFPRGHLPFSPPAAHVPTAPSAFFLLKAHVPLITLALPSPFGRNPPPPFFCLANVSPVETLVSRPTVLPLPAPLFSLSG